MPRGDNPNSREALKRGVRFTDETAKERGRAGAAKSNAKQKSARLFKDILKDALKQEFKDEKVLARLRERGALGDDEKIDMKTAISYIRLLREIDNPSPDGFDRLAKILGEIEEEQTSAANITINVPPEYRA